MKKMSEGITKEQIQKLYEENTADDAAKKLRISTSCLYSYLKDLEIPLKGRGGKKRRKLTIIG